MQNNFPSVGRLGGIVDLRRRGARWPHRCAKWTDSSHDELEACDPGYRANFSSINFRR
jgi:hypothetical protein